MIETLSLLLGLGFSLIVYVRTIRTSPHSRSRKSLYTVLSTIGITGMLWLSGILIANFLREAGLR